MSGGYNDMKRSKRKRKTIETTSEEKPVAKRIESLSEEKPAAKKIESSTVEKPATKKIESSTVEKPAADTAGQQSSKHKKKKEVAIFGNYRHYYGYRVGQDLDEDPRLRVMKREWFEGNECLDIGCNSGLITIAVAKKFGCKSILGVDIDGARIEDACWTLRKVLKTSMPKATSKVPGSGHVNFGNSLKDNASELPPKEAPQSDGNSPLLEAKDLDKIVSFQKGNFVQNWHPPAHTSYHAILCLSVTKWIHLNWGDNGLLTLFWRVWKLLKPGGVFILEPQPWSSYVNNRQVSETASVNYKNIQIPPEEFQDILLDKIGFRQVENLTAGLSGTKSGFNRPILAFWK
ncbi:probable RNA methyltransferase At5g51130 [Andrographis paniculata]|uniref:probable RNA methyltransferase At5g51130 n=1 Tax=Andrographis paniculata TaxID=175694 RepID=UPI0021E70173|nr:probable RNA methyltransferase At5g51130 [Andrographis paniculata]